MAWQNWCKIFAVVSNIKVLPVVRGIWTKDLLRHSLWLHFDGTPHLQEIAHQVNYEAIKTMLELETPQPS